MFYQFALQNVVSYLRRTTEKQRESGERLTAFQISEVLAIVFCKDKADIVADLLAMSFDREPGGSVLPP
jgi:hypothetical protein